MALTKQQKILLEKKIYNMLMNTISESEKKSDKKNSDNLQTRRENVMKWLDTDQSNHAPLAYELWNVTSDDDVEKGNARSLFTKKFKGHDPSGKEYKFTDDEINKLYNMKDRYLKIFK